jgi:hypothetical protein
MTFIKRIRRKDFGFFSFFAAIGLFLISSCNDMPSDLAVNLLPDTVAVKTLSSEDTLIITGRTVYAPHYPIFNNGSVFIGKFNDITAATLLNFAYLPDTLGNIKEEQIESAVLNLYPERYAYGDTLGGTMGFDVYRVIRRWTPDSTTYDSLFVSPSNYFATEKIQSWEGKITLKDTMDKISINLPSNLIIDWLKTEMVLDTATKTMKPKRIANWGLAFVPKQNSTVIHRFVASAPTQVVSTSLIVKYKKEGQDTLSYLNLLSGVDVSFLKTPLPDTNEVVIQNGLNYWTRFDFDLSMIPKFAGIHKAQFELTLDESRSRKGNVPLDTIVELAYFLNGKQSTTFDYTGYRVEKSNKYLFPSITSMVQFKNKYDGKFSLVLLPYTLNNQSRELERLTFYGISNPDLSKRPILKIIYSLNPAYLEPKK